MKIKILRTPIEYEMEVGHYQKINELGCHYCKNHDLEIVKINHPTNWIYHAKCYKCHMIAEIDFGNIIRLAWEKIKVKSWHEDEEKFIESQLNYYEEINAIMLDLFGIYGDHINSYDVTEDVLNGLYD